MEPNSITDQQQPQTSAQQTQQFMNPGDSQPQQSQQAQFQQPQAPQQNQSQPAQAQQFQQPQEQKPKLPDHQGLFRSIFETLAGGPKTSYKINPDTGQMEKTTEHLTKKGISAGIVAGAVTGMLAGMGEKGPGSELRSFSAGGQATAAGIQQKDQKAQQMAKDDYARNLNVFETNMRMHQNALHMGQMDQEFNQKYVDDHKDLYNFLQTNAPQAIKGTATEADLEKYHITKDNAIPVGVVPRMGPDGQQITDKFGAKQSDLLYAIVDPEATAPLTEEDKARAADIGLPGFANSKGEAIKLPQNAALKVRTQLNTKAKITAYDIANKNLGDYYNSLNTQGGAGGDNIWNLFPNMDTLADAITKHEGADTNRKSNNNPGNLRFKGDKKVDRGGFHIYDSLEEGQKALISQLERDKARNPNYTVDQYVLKYQGPEGKETGNKPGSLKAYSNAIYDAAGVEPNEKKDASYTPVDLKDAVRKDPTLLDALTKWPGGVKDPEQAIAEIAKKDPLAASKISALYGGDKAINDYRNQRTANVKQTEERNKKNEQLREKALEADEKKRQAIEDMRPAAKAVAAGAMDQLRELLAKRFSSPVDFVNLVREYNPNWNIEDAKQKLDVWENFTKDSGKDNQSIQSMNTFMGHAADFIESVEHYRGTLQNFNQVAGKGIKYFKDKFGNDPEYSRMETALEPAKTEFVNFLNNQHALTENDKQMAAELLNPATPVDRAEAIMKQMARTAMIRLNTVNDKWKRTFREDHPDMLNSRSVDSVRLMNDPVVNQIAGSLKSGGFTTGSITGAGSGGRYVRDILSGKTEQPQAPQGATQVYKDASGAVKGYAINGKYVSAGGQ